jgi:hypothetical protein
MKMKVYVLDLELPKPTQKTLRIGGLAAALLLGGTIAGYAAVRHTFTGGEVISAQQVNENFADLDTRLDEVDERFLRRRPHQSEWHHVRRVGSNERRVHGRWLGDNRLASRQGHL